MCRVRCSNADAYWLTVASIDAANFGCGAGGAIQPGDTVWLVSGRYELGAAPLRTATVATASATAVTTDVKAAIIEIMNTLAALGLWKGGA
jgi:hypothetical protein